MDRIELLKKYDYCYKRGKEDAQKEFLKLIEEHIQCVKMHNINNVQATCLDMVYKNIQQSLGEKGK